MTRSVSRAVFARLGRVFFNSRALALAHLTRETLNRGECNDSRFSDDEVMAKVANLCSSLVLSCHGGSQLAKLPPLQDNAPYLQHDRALTEMPV